jgi:hypothetical protein
LRTRFLGRLKIAQRITYSGYACQSHVKALADIDEHSRFWLAAAAAGIGSVRAEEDGVDPSTYLKDGVVHFLIDTIESGHVE